MNRPGITLCRGCCCGTANKRPEVDHDHQRARLHKLVQDGIATLRESDCLGPCDEANVVVVRPSPSARLTGARPTWIGHLDDARTDALITWIHTGGPGRAPLPAALHAHLIPVERR